MADPAEATCGPRPSGQSASGRQIKSAQQADQLSIGEFHALPVGGRQQLERTSLQTLVENAKTVLVPKQELQTITLPVHEQE